MRTIFVYLCLNKLYIYIYIYIYYSSIIFFLTHMHIYNIYIYNNLYTFLFVFYFGGIISSDPELYEVLPYNNMIIISPRIRFLVITSVVRADLFAKIII